MIRRTTTVLIAAVALSLAAPTLGAQDTPRGLWFKIKCALCHGEDGSSDTPTGRKTKAPDMRTDEIQDLEDDELEKRISEGHAKMPSFKRRLTDKEVKLLLLYVRELGEKAKADKGGS